MNLVGPFPVSAVIERLAQIPELRLVSGAAGLEAALERAPAAMPAAYVLSEETGREPGDYSGAAAQPMTVVVQVVLWLRHAGDYTGGRATQEMEVLERAVRSHLRDWSPAYPFEPLWVSNSGRDQFVAGQMIRQLIFRTHYRDQEQP